MYLTITYTNSDKKRFINVPEDLTISQIQILVSTLSVCPGVDKVWINVREAGSNEKTNNSNSN